MSEILSTPEGARRNISPLRRLLYAALAPQGAPTDPVSCFSLDHPAATAPEHIDEWVEQIHTLEEPTVEPTNAIFAWFVGAARQDLRRHPLRAEFVLPYLSPREERQSLYEPVRQLEALVDAPPTSLDELRERHRQLLERIDEARVAWLERIDQLQEMLKDGTD